ncbi:MAG: serine/threonine-protein kinase [Pseudolysinimonas sp.]
MRRSASSPPALAGYEAVRLLGAGGFSDVFLYNQHLPRRQVAVKVLLNEELTEQSRQAFNDEANLMAQLSAHPYIVTIYAADVTEHDQPYFVMEYCAGPSLSDRYKAERFTVADAVRTGIRLSSAIATAHDAGILHRDIKPANVLTNDYGWPALTDFGISSTVDDVPLATMTTGQIHQDAETSGTTESQSIGMSVPWSPPEMFADNPQPDVRSDIFSLAATIWTLLAGRTPFEVPGRPNGTLDLIGRIERGMITPMPRDDVPRSLIAVLQKGMATRRTDRYKSAVDFARALQRIEIELGYAPTTIEVPKLAVADARPDPVDGEDETRVRSVATIAAQPTASPIAAPPASVPAASPAAQPDATRVRSVKVVGQQADSLVDEATIVRGAPTSTPTSAPDDVPAEGSGIEAPARRRPPVAVIVGIVVAILVAGGVTAAIVATGGKVQTIATEKPTGESAVDPGAAVAAPKFQGATISGTTVTYTFAAVPGADGYRWNDSESPSDTSPISTPVVTRTGVAPGAKACVQLVAIVHGRTSAPSEGCSTP